jgi:hypothetical protein
MIRSPRFAGRRALQVCLLLAAILAIASSIAPKGGASNCTPGTPPVLKKAPQLSGTPAVGNTLTTSNGTWTYCDPNATFHYSYQWYSGTHAIVGATNASYTITEDEAGFGIYAAVTATVNGGDNTADSNTLFVPGAQAIGSDQSAATGDETTLSPAAPVPMSPTGPVTSGYTTELWSADDSNTSDGLQVVSSSSSGTFALTGSVLSQTNGSAVASATVTLTCSTCSSVTTSTDAAGTFAFINMSPGAYSFTVSASGYGSYQLINDTYSGDQQYAISAELNSSNQQYDESQAPADPQNLTGTNTGYQSQRRVPPSIRVALIPEDTQCNPTAAYVAGDTILNYWWKFYILHVVGPEIGYQDNEAETKAFMSWAQNYAWYTKIHLRTTDPYDVDETTNYQCFHPEAKVLRVWKTWLDEVLANRIANPDGTIQETPYRKGQLDCSDSQYYANGNLGSQLGLQALYNQCGYTTWQSLAEYYFTGTVVAGSVPPNPATSFSRVTGGVSFTFKSLVGSSLVGWRYVLEKKTSTGWIVIYNRGWSTTTRSVPTTFTYHTSNCFPYRVRATNPVGTSPYSDFNGGSQICPG